MKNIFKTMRQLLYDKRGQFQFEHAFLGLGLSTVVLICLATAAASAASDAQKVAAQAKLQEIAAYVGSVVSDAYILACSTATTSGSSSNPQLVLVSRLDLPSEFNGHIYVVDATKDGSDKYVIEVYAIDRIDWRATASVFNAEARHAGAEVTRLVLTGTITSSMSNPTVWCYRYPDDADELTTIVWIKLGGGVQ